MPTEKISQFIDAKAPMLTALSDEIWEYAETAFVEFRSAEAIISALKQESFHVEEGIAGIPTAFSGSFGSGHPVIGLLGEYDALFNLSQEPGVSYRKEYIPGAPGHGCGHNLLGVGALGAAIAVKEYLQQTGMPGTVIFYGCPGEEGGSGKAFMAREGVFDCLDAAFTWHPAPSNDVRRKSSLANIQVAFKFTGVSAHAAGDPYNGRSALDAVELMNVGVQFLREHMIPQARIHYAITNSGGNSPNVVQPYAEVLYLVRAPQNKPTVELYERVIKIAKGAAMMTETDLEIDVYKACSNIINNETLERLLEQEMLSTALPEYTDEELAFAEKIKETSPPSPPLSNSCKDLGMDVVADIDSKIHGPLHDFVLPYKSSDVVESSSTDVGDTSWVCPTAQINAATWCLGVPGHSWQITAQGKSSYAHKGMLYAAKVMAGATIQLMKSPELIEKAKKEHKLRVGPEGYVCPIPAGVKPRPINKG